MIRTLVIASLTAAAVVAGVAFLATPSAPVKANTSAVNSHRHEIQRTTNLSVCLALLPGRLHS